MRGAAPGRTISRSAFIPDFSATRHPAGVRAQGDKAQPHRGHASVRFIQQQRGHPLPAPGWMGGDGPHPAHLSRTRCRNHRQPKDAYLPDHDVPLQRIERKAGKRSGIHASDQADQLRRQGKIQAEQVEMQHLERIHVVVFGDAHHRSFPCTGMGRLCHHSRKERHSPSSSNSARKMQSKATAAPVVLTTKCDCQRAMPRLPRTANISWVERLSARSTPTSI